MLMLNWKTDESSEELSLTEYGETSISHLANFIKHGVRFQLFGQQIPLLFKKPQQLACALESIFR